LPFLQVTFLAGLPAMRGLNMQYLRALSHCFHQVTFEPREVVVQQGDISDSMFVLKSGQVSPCWGCSRGWLLMLQDVQHASP
jgi:hypothetical protein